MHCWEEHGSGGAAALLGATSCGPGGCFYGRLLPEDVQDVDSRLLLFCFKLEQVVLGTDSLAELSLFLWAFCFEGELFLLVIP